MLAVLLVAAVAVAACGTYKSEALHESAFDLDALVEALGAAGAQVRVKDRVDQPFLSGSGRVLAVNGHDVQVFQYASEAAAEADASRVSPDGGTVGGTAIMWVGRPHFYRKGLLVALYLGDDVPTLSALQAALGPPFAGA
jgi:hypothetical protein